MKKTYDPLDIRSQEEAQATAELAARLARETEEEDVRWLMGSRRGRRICWRILEQAGVFKSTFNTTAMQMAFNEGFRQFGLNVLALIHLTSHDHYSTMVKENANAARRTDGNTTATAGTNP